MRLFNRVTIVGLGLIGGSLGMAIRRKRLAREVVGLSRTTVTIREARRRGAIEWGTTDARVAVANAELVVLAGPVDAIVPTATRLARLMTPGAILTDVGSTKGAIVRTLERTLPKPATFVGAHPLAGSEARGIQAAQADLFDGSICVLTTTAQTDRRALRHVRQLWTPLVRRVITMDPTRHDRLLAAVSHLPHLLAFSLVQATDHHALSLAPRSFLDATRVARSAPDLWDDIFLTNRPAVLAAIERFDRTWASARQLLLRADRRRLQQFLHQAHAIRTTLHDS